MAPESPDDRTGDDSDDKNSEEDKAQSHGDISKNLPEEPEEFEEEAREAAEEAGKGFKVRWDTEREFEGDKKSTFVFLFMVALIILIWKLGPVLADILSSGCGV